MREERRPEGARWTLGQTWPKALYGCRRRGHTLRRRERPRKPPRLAASGPHPEGRLRGAWNAARAGERAPSASFLKSGIHKRMAGPPTGKGGDRAETTARRRTPEHRGSAKDTQTRRKSPRSRRLDLPRPHHLFELARSAHRQDSPETRLSSEDRKQAPPPLQRRRDRRPRRPPRRWP